MNKLLFILLVLPSLHVFTALAMDKPISDAAKIKREMDDFNTDLYQAVKTKNRTKVLAILESPTEIDKTFALNHALMKACSIGSVDLCELLIDHGANPHWSIPIEKIGETKYPSRFTPFMAACAKGHLETGEFLLQKHHVDLGARCTDGLTPLMIAAIKNHPKICAFILNHRPESLEERETECNEYGPLTAAIHSQSIETCEYLIQCGASLHGDNRRLPAYYYAVQHGSRAIIELLLRHNAPREVEDLNSQILWSQELVLAACKGNVAGCQLFLEHGASILPPCATEGNETILSKVAYRYDKLKHEHVWNTEKRQIDLNNLEATCFLLVNCQKEREKRMFTLLASLKHAKSEVAKLLYQHRKYLLTPYLKQYLVNRLLINKHGNNPYFYLWVDWLKPN